MKPSTKKFIRSLVWRTTQDNKQRPGALFVAGFGLAFVIGIYAVTRPRTQYTNMGPAKAATGLGATAKVEAERAVSTGASYSRADPLHSRPDPITQSTRLETAPTASTAPSPSTKQEPAGFLDTVRMATKAQQDVPREDKRGRPISNGLPDGFIDEGDAGVQAPRRGGAPGAGTAGVAGSPISVGQPIQVQTGNMDMAGLTVYKRDKSAKAAAKKTGFDIGNFLPLGQKIQVAFVEDVTTKDLSGLVELGVVSNVEFGGDVIRLPYGVRIYGTASTKNVGDRVAITVQTIVFPETGQEIPISGIVLDEDGQPGVRGYYIPQPELVQAFPYVNTGIAALLESLKAKSTVVTQTATGTTTSNGEDTNSLGNIALSAAQKGITDTMTKKQEELDRRYPAHVLVRRGTPATIRLTKALDLEARGFGAKGTESAPTEATQATLDALKAALPFNSATTSLRPQAVVSPQS